MATNTDSGSTYIVLCLGLLIGFVVGFVLLLSSLPVDDGLADYEVVSTRAASVDSSERKFDFYKFLPNKVVRPDPEPIPIASAATPAMVIQPATRVVPANAQIVNHQYHEVQAKYNTDNQVDSQRAGAAQQTGFSQSYFLQAGKYQQHEQAQSMRAQVLLIGLDAFIVTRIEADGSTAHRVRVGPYYDQSILTEAKKRLSRGGINYEIVRVTG